MADKTPPRFRKTKSDKWAVMAPVEDLERALASGGKIEVLKRSGEWSSFTVASLGKPFDVDGVQMCYGYGPDDDGPSEPEPGPASSAGVGGTAGTARSGPAPRSRSASKANGRSTGSPPQPPPPDPTEPLPEYQGGPEDEWDGYF